VERVVPNALPKSNAVTPRDICAVGGRHRLRIRNGCEATAGLSSQSTLERKSPIQLTEPYLRLVSDQPGLRPRPRCRTRSRRRVLSRRGRRPWGRSSARRSSCRGCRRSRSSCRRRGCRCAAAGRENAHVINILFMLAAGRVKVVSGRIRYVATRVIRNDRNVIPDLVLHWIPFKRIKGIAHWYVRRPCHATVGAPGVK